MDLVAYLGSVLTIAGLAAGGMYMIVHVLADRFDDINNRFEDINNRFGDMNHRFDQMDRRIDRLETQNASIMEAISDLGQRLTRLEH